MRSLQQDYPDPQEETESSEWIIEDHAFSPCIIWLLPPPPPLPSASSTGDTQETEKERQLADGMGGGGEGGRKGGKSQNT
jgi:hypothetical protein